MKKSPLSTPGCHTGNFQHQNRGRRGGYGYHQSRNNSNDTCHMYSRPNNPPNTQFDNQVIPADSSSPVFYHKRGNRRPMFNRHNNQRFSNTGLSSSNDNQRTFQNNLDSPYQRNPNHFRQKNEHNWHRNIPITEFIDLKSIFENPWAELEKDIAYSQQSNSFDNPSIETVLENNELKDTLSDNDVEENSTDVDNSHDEQKDESSVDLQLDGINFNSDSININASI